MTYGLQSSYVVDFSLRPLYTNAHSPWKMKAFSNVLHGLSVLRYIEKW